MKKNDILIALAAVILALVWLLILRVGRQSGSMVHVYVDGTETAAYDLYTPKEITIEGIHAGTNILTIQNGYASITEASCPDRLCVYQQAISKAGETLVCLPNRVVIEISGGEETEYDAVTN